MRYEEKKILTQRHGVHGEEIWRKRFTQRRRGAEDAEKKFGRRGSRYQ